MGKIGVVRRRKDKNKGLEPNLYPQFKKLATGETAVYYRYVNPQTGDATPFGRVTRERANNAARILNERLAVGGDLVRKALGIAGLSWGKVLEKFEADYPKWGKWGKRTAYEHRLRLNKYRRDLGDKDFESYTLKELSDYIDNEFTGDGRIKNRQLLIEVYRYAVSKGICSENLAEKTLAPIPGKRMRHRMTPELFKAVRTHKECPGWLACAMDLSLKTLQGSAEIVAAGTQDIGPGFVSFIRNKTKDRTERAYIKVPLDDELRDILDRCKALPVHGTRLIRRKPKRQPRKDDMTRKGGDWSRVTRRQLNEEFCRIRDLTGLVDHIPEERRPTYYENRSLGSRMLRKQLRAAGMPDHLAKQAVNALLGHTTMKTTNVYLQGDEPEWTECGHTLKISAL